MALDSMIIQYRDYDLTVRYEHRNTSDESTGYGDELEILAIELSDSIINIMRLLDENDISRIESIVMKQING